MPSPPPYSAISVRHLQGDGKKREAVPVGPRHERVAEAHVLGALHLAPKRAHFQGEPGAAVRREGRPRLGRVPQALLRGVLQKAGGESVTLEAKSVSGQRAGAARRRLTCRRSVLVNTGLTLGRCSRSTACLLPGAAIPKECEAAARGGEAEASSRCLLWGWLGRTDEKIGRRVELLDKLRK